jgi:hypothetical protein
MREPFFVPFIEFKLTLSNLIVNINLKIIDEKELQKIKKTEKNCSERESYDSYTDNISYYLI